MIVVWIFLWDANPICYKFLFIAYGAHSQLFVVFLAVGRLFCRIFLLPVLAEGNAVKTTAATPRDLGGVLQACRWTSLMDKPLFLAHD